VLQETLRSVAQLFDGLLKERNLNLTMELPEMPAVLFGDKDRLQQVFVNVFANAVKFTEQGGIHVRLTKHAGAFQVEVEDTGPGISQENFERVFDKFERVGTQTEEGSGLGLPIARDIIHLHHGRIWVESEAGKGSRFKVWLPIQPLDPDHGDGRGIPHAASPATR
jgi:signal transduction histidine kinase